MVDKENKIIVHLNGVLLIITIFLVAIFLLISFLIPSLIQSSSLIQETQNPEITVAPLAGIPSTTLHNQIMQQAQDAESKIQKTENTSTRNSNVIVQFIFLLLGLLLTLFVFYLWLRNSIELNGNRLKIHINLGSLLFFNLFFSRNSFPTLLTIESLGLKNTIAEYHTNTIIDIQSLISIEVFKQMTLGKSYLKPEIQNGDVLLLIYQNNALKEKHGVFIMSSYFPSVKRIIDVILTSRPELSLHIHNALEAVQTSIPITNKDQTISTYSVNVVYFASIMYIVGLFLGITILDYGFPLLKQVQNVPGNFNLVPYVYGIVGFVFLATLLAIFGGILEIYKQKIHDPKFKTWSMLYLALALIIFMVNAAFPLFNHI